MRVLGEVLTRPGHRLGRVLVALAALAGLVAMHGLGDHGTTHDPVSMVTTHDHAMPPAPVASVAGDDAAPAMPAHDMTTMVGLCLAVLGAALLLAWALGRRLGGARPLARLTGLLLRLTPTAARDPVGPDRLQLSVHRC